MADLLRNKAFHGAALLAAGLIFASGARAQSEPTFVEEVQPPPPIVSGETLEPDVTIVRSETRTVYEYRVAGQLRAVKVVPSVGPAYYLIDSDGDGRLETQTDGFDSGLLVNSWVLFSW